MMNRDAKIYVAGHCGLVGGGLFAAGAGSSKHRPARALATCAMDRRPLSSSPPRPRLCDRSGCKGGGIHANNTYPAQFIYDNPRRHEHGPWAYRHDVKKLLFWELVHAPEVRAQPMPEDCC